MNHAQRITKFECLCAADLHIDALRFVVAEAASLADMPIDVLQEWMQRGAWAGQMELDRTSVNQTTQRIIDLFASNDPETATIPLHTYGELLYRGESGISYWRIGDDVLCVQSVTQCDFAGHLAKEPRFKEPAILG